MSATRAASRVTIRVAGVEASAGVQALTTLHVERGLEIGPRTGVPGWFGERMDYNEAVGALQERAERGRMGEWGAIA